MSFDGDQYPSDEGLDLTTKGQIHTHDTSANAALNVGANTYLLTADSTETTGMKWAAAAGASVTTSTVNAYLSADFTTTSNTATVLTGITFTLPTISGGKCFIGFSGACYRSTAGGIQGNIQTDTTGSDAVIVGTGRGAEVPSATYASNPKWNFASQAIHDADGSDITYYCWTGGGSLIFKGSSSGEYATSMSALGVG